MSSHAHEAAFREMFDTYETSIRAYCLRRLPASHVDDAVADTFLTVWRRRHDAPQGDELRLWLYGVARNVVRNDRRSTERSRRLRNRIIREPIAYQESPEVVVVRNAEERYLLAAIARLRPVEREILLLRTWERLSSSDVAIVMCLTPKAVDNRLARIKKKLTKMTAEPAAVILSPDPPPVVKGGEI
ncbi:MAG: sigma-70 family RNA polymerase sigma factor [Actinomycetia bacterium]|nr:sigma-70 family RNA polymerase sigma factor [Actinomycetes bacterium]